MTLRPSLSGSSCLPATRSLHRGGELAVFRLPLVIAKDGTAIRSHEIIDGSNACDGDQLREWIDAKLHLEFGDKKCQVERTQSKRRIELVCSTESAGLTKTLLQHGPNLFVHDRFNLFRRAPIQHVIPPSISRICPVMKDACSDTRKYTAFAMSSALASRPSGVRRTIRCFCSSVRRLAISLSK